MPHQTSRKQKKAPKRILALTRLGARKVGRTQQSDLLERPANVRPAGTWPHARWCRERHVLTDAFA